MQPTEDYLTCEDGFRLVYRRIGQGPPLILLHGWACPGRFFEPLLPRLAHQFTLWIPDQRGHGASGSPEQPPLLEHLAADLAALIAAIGEPKVNLLGWSMGAMVAWEYIRQFGEQRLERLVILDMTAKVLNDGAWQFGIRDGFDALSSLKSLHGMLSDWPRYRQLVVAGLSASDREPSESFSDWCLERMGESDPRDLASLWVSLCSQDYRPLLGSIAIPTLLIGGRQSRLYEEASLAYVTTHLRNAQLRMLEGCGHGPPLEAPDRCAQLLEEFLAEQPASNG